MKSSLSFLKHQAADDIVNEIVVDRQLGDTHAALTALAHQSRVCGCLVAGLEGVEEGVTVVAAERVRLVPTVAAQVVLQSRLLHSAHHRQFYHCWGYGSGKNSLAGPGS
jgi:hypothetical protein